MGAHELKELDLAPAFPADLMVRAQWLAFKFEQKDGEPKPRKVPYYVSGRRRSGVQGSVEDRAALVTHAQALDAVRTKGFSGLGFAFLPDDGLIGIDIDKAFGVNDPVREERARGIIKACASFTEFSPSGTGVHIIVAGHAKTFKDNGVGIEVFCGRQFFTMTGDTYPDAVLDVLPIREDVLQRLYEVVKGKPVDTSYSPRPNEVAAGNRGGKNEELDPDRLDSALACVSCEDYHEWVAIGMGLKADLGDAGFAIWDKWSARSAKYAGSEVCRKKWKSFTQLGSVGVGKIYRAAVDAGWKPPRKEYIAPVRSPAPSEVGDVQPAAQETPDGGEGEGYDLPGLLRDFCLITGPKSLSVWHSREMYDMGKGAFEALVGKPLAKEWIESTAKRKIKQSDVRALKRQRDDKDRADDEEFIAHCDRYIYLDGSASVWDERLRCIISQSAVKMAMGAAFDLWVNSPIRKSIPMTNVVFDPLQRCDTESHINLFRGLPLSPVNRPERCQAIIELVHHLCNFDADDADWLLRWLAYPLQNVGAKMATAVLMHSKTHGSGKSWLFEECVKPLYGEYGATLGQDQLESNYTGWQSKRLFGLFEEVLASNQRYSHTGKLKHMITGKTQNIEKKFIDSWEESNHMNSVFLSNNLQPFHVEDSDRRFQVIWPDKTTPASLKERVDFELKNDGLLAFYGYLIDYPMTFKTVVEGKEVEEVFGPHTKPIMNTAKRRLIEFGLSGWELFLREWESGEFGAGSYCSCLSQDLYALFRCWAHATNEKAKDSFSLNKFSNSVGSCVPKAVRHFRIFGMGTKQKTVFKVGLEPRGMAEMDYLGEQIVHFRNCAKTYGVKDEDLVDLSLANKVDVASIPADGAY